MLFLGLEGMNEPSNKICFGTGTDRPTFPDQIANDRFGNENTPFRGVKNVGPGQYDNHIFTSFTNIKKPISTKGYVARTGQKDFYQLVDRAPSPTLYQDINRAPIKKSLKPFHSSSNRFKKEASFISPGPGCYEHQVERNRNVQALHSFGGRTKSVPHVDIKCIVNQNIICDNCGEKPEGDFFEYKSKSLCSRCYDYNYKWQEKYNRAYLTSFKKTRDCAFMHEHEGTTAVIQKISDKELKKLKQKEAYLSLYWS
ncbi:putative protein pitchfork-like [Brachionus plicatilis]|uniref:Uncharacterized protein n=1 Tax=Brachionus plicatilis TaxID=10195 RepID=A0A3M7RSZ7_BRAPC|nr:putative protein pitchfork-like [Brachionus plicatilis]